MLQTNSWVTSWYQMRQQTGHTLIVTELRAGGHILIICYLYLALPAASLSGLLRGGSRKKHIGHHFYWLFVEGFEHFLNKKLFLVCKFQHYIFSIVSVPHFFRPLLQLTLRMYFSQCDLLCPQSASQSELRDLRLFVLSRTLVKTLDAQRPNLIITLNVYADG